MKQYDVAAYIWPAYTGDEPRTRVFWPEGYGEWQTVKAMKPVYEGHQWPRRPLWGYVNEADPYVMEMEIEAADAHGVNVFIYDWYWFDNRPFLEQCLNNGYLCARNREKVKFFLMWANHTATTLWDKRTSDLLIPIWDGAVDRQTLRTIAARVTERYFHQPSYYKIDGKPVFLIYDIFNFVHGLGGVKGALEGLELLREEAVRSGLPGVELLMVLRGGEKLCNTMLDETTSVRDFINSAGIDGVTHYQFCDITKTGRPYRELLPDVRAEWDRIGRELTVPFYPHISVGWDSNPRYNRLHNSVTRENTPEEVQRGFAMAKEYLDAHTELRAPLLTVNSWNEWTEGSYLEPDDLYGYGYLEAIRKTFLT